MVLITTDITVESIICELENNITEYTITDESIVEKQIDDELHLTEDSAVLGSISELLKKLPTRMKIIILECGAGHESVDLSGLKDKQGLEILILHGMSVLRDSIKDLPTSIIKLELKNCRLTNEDIECISLPNLKILDLSSNLIDHLSSKAIQCISHVQYLTLKENRFNHYSIINTLLDSMPDLERLSLDRTPIFGSIDNTVIARHKRIKHIFLVDTYITRSVADSKIEYVECSYAATCIGIVDSTDGRVKVYILEDDAALLCTIGTALQNVSRAKDANTFYDGVLILKDSFTDLVKKQMSDLEKKINMLASNQKKLLRMLNSRD